MVAIDVLYLVDRLEALLGKGWRVPMTSKTMIDEDEFLDIVDQMRIAFPEEIKQAKKIVQDRERVIAQAQEEATRIIALAKEDGARLTNDHAVAKSAQQQAAQINQQANATATAIRQGADEYAAQVLKELQERVKDAKEATRAAIEEGVIPGGGVTYLRARKVLSTLKNKDEDVAAGIKIVHEALAMPVRKLAENSGADGGWVVHEVMKSELAAYGFNALTLEFGDMLKQGVIDPAKVAKHALRNAASVAGMILTTRALITDVKEDKKVGGMSAGAGDMGMM